MEITELLRKAGSGDADAEEKLIPLVYSELKRLAAGHLRGQWNVTLNPTGLVHEAFLRVAVLKDPRFENRAHFFGIASRIMRNVLVDLIRHTNTKKRGGGMLTIQLEDLPELGDSRSKDVLRLDDALTRLAEEYPRQASAIEMRFFGGMSVLEMASALEVSEATVKRDIRFAQAWLKREMASEPS